MDMDHDHEMLKVYNLQLSTSGSAKIFSDLLDKIFSSFYNLLYVFSLYKLVSITSFKASPLSLLDVHSSKERGAAGQAHCTGRYLVSGAGDIMSPPG